MEDDMRKLGTKKLVNRSKYPRGYNISFRVPEGLYKIICLKANEDNRFVGSPGLYVRHLIEKGFEPTDIKSIKTLLLAQNDLLQKLLYRSDITQVTLESIIKYELGHHSEPPIEAVERINNVVEMKFETMMQLIIKSFQKNGNMIQRMISDQITV